MQRLIAPSTTYCVIQGLVIQLSTFFLMAMMSASIVRPDSTCRWAYSNVVSFGTIPEYHTSADNLAFISADHLAQSYRLLVASLDVIENDFVCNNVLPLLRTSAR